MSLRKGILKNFNSGNYKATIQIAGSNRVYLEGISVARNIPAVEMALGRNVGVIFFDEYNTKESVVIAIYT